MRKCNLSLPLQARPGNRPIYCAGAPVRRSVHPSELHRSRHFRAEIKRVKQKLNEIMVLAERAKAGDIKLNYDQKQKIARKKEFERELKALRKAEEDGQGLSTQDARPAKPPAHAAVSRDAAAKDAPGRNAGGAGPAKPKLSAGDLLGIIGIPHGTVSRTARYPARHGIPRGTVHARPAQRPDRPVP